MNRLTILLTLILGSCVAQQAIAAPPTPIHTNKKRFRIPYRFDTAELNRIGAREVRLYVSTDHGKTWNQSQTVAPDAGRFEYNATTDDEYWFSVRTIDKKGKFYPAGQTVSAGLAVIVDSTPPTLDISLKQPVPGRVELVWSASDAYLKAESLRLESRNSPKDKWQSVSVAPAANGRTAWTLPSGGQVEVRGFIVDMASNEASSHEKIEIGKKAFVRPKNNPLAVPTKNQNPYVPDFNQPIAKPPAAADLPRFSNMVPTPSPKLPLPAEPEINQFPDFANSAPTMLPPQKVASLPSQLPSQFPTLPPQMNTQMTPQLSPQLAPQQNMQYQQQPKQQFASSRPWMKPQITQGRYPANNTTNQWGGQNAGVRRNVRTSNSHQFQIGYQLEDIGPSGVSGVELFITEDNGNKWWKYGEDADQKSPFDVSVPNDGRYGFAIRVRNGVGLSAQPPQSGETPSIVVIADATFPVIDSFQVHQGQGRNFNQLTLSWALKEANLAEKPISLYYSSEMNGPWEPIIGWQADRGAHHWTVGPNAPPKLYFRIMARDAVGNVSYQATSEPILIDLAQPTARILDVAPLPAGQGIQRY